MATLESSGVRSRWYEDDNHNTSALRLIVVPGAMIGILVALAGTVAMFMSLPAAPAALTTGAGMVATAQISKSWQKSNEKGV